MKGRPGKSFNSVADFMFSAGINVKLSPNQCTWACIHIYTCMSIYIYMSIYDCMLLTSRFRANYIAIYICICIYSACRKLRFKLYIHYIKIHIFTCIYTYRHSTYVCMSCACCELRKLCFSSCMHAATQGCWLPNVQCSAALKFFNLYDPLDLSILCLFYDPFIHQPMLPISALAN